MLGNVKKLKGPNGATTSYTYDNRGRLISQSTTAGTTLKYQYNELNLRKQLTNARGQSIRFLYDPSGRISVYTTPEGAVSFNYDDNGNIIRSRDNQGSITRTFDALNRVTSCTDTFGKTIGYEYDEVGYKFFKATFDSGLFWESVGYDLSNTDVYIPQQAKNRANNNLYKTFSEDQIAFLYYLDPLGVQNYVKYYYTSHDAPSDDEEFLFFKDRIYKKIFGKAPRLINVTIGKTLIYYDYPNSITYSTREKYYSDAEVLFGEHSKITWGFVVSFVADVAISAISSLLSINIESAGTILTAINICNFLFFAAAVNDMISSGVTSSYELYITELNDDKMLKRVQWPLAALGLVQTIIYSIEENITFVDNIEIYEKVTTENFQTKFLVNNSQMSINELIQYYNPN